MDEMQKESMIAYLNSHPEFLLQNKMLLTEVLLPHPVTDNSSGNIVSLVEIQTKIQRNEIHELKDRLKAQNTDSNNLHESLQAIRKNLPSILESHPLADAYDIFYNTLKYNFSATVIKSILFIQPPIPVSLEKSGLIIASKNDKRKTFFLEVFQRRKALCGILQEELMYLLFNESYPNLASTMIYPVRIEKNDGLIAIASSERDRYAHGTELELLCLLCDLFVRTVENSLNQAANTQQLRSSS